ncbi:MAG: LptA/OstA family protein [Verrucomicrobiota bacterium]
MKSLVPFLPVAILFFATPLHSQNSALDEAEEAGRNLFDNPDFQNVLRSVKKDPEGTVESITGDHEGSVREATQLFMDGKRELESSSLNTPENREKFQRISDAAVTRATEMASENEEVVAEARAAIQGTPAAPAAPAAPVVASPVAAQPSGGTAPSNPVASDLPSPPPASEAIPAAVPATRPASSSTRFVTPITMPEENAATPLAADMAPQPVVQDESVQPIASAAPTEQRIPDLPGLDPGSVPAPQPLSPKYDTKKGGYSAAAGTNEMVITARNSVMDNNTGLLTFTGDVFVDYPDFDIKCDRLEIYMDQTPGAAPTEGGGSFKKAIASGGMVEIQRIGEGGKKQTALAKRAEFDNLTKDVILSGGPPYIQDGDSFVETNSADAKIIMRGTGKYEITGSDAGTKGRSRIVIPVKDSGQNADTGIGGGLGGILDRSR